MSHSSNGDAAAGRRRSLPSPQSLRAILFDVDGTLCDSDPVHYQAFRDMLQEVGFQGGAPITREYFCGHISGKHNRDIGLLLFPDWDEAKRSKFFDDKEAYFRGLAAKDLKALPGLHKLCKWIKEKGLRRAAVSNAPKENVEFMISQVGLEGFFETVILGSDCARAKPFPDPYLKALDHFGITADNAFVFEDSPSGIKAGVAAGMAVVGLTTGNPEAALREAGATFLAKNYDDPAIWAALE
ncbi:haloacid dehalogenase-like hydrolase domain-containing protein Sgpp [Selaginella moellendorffii]|nr:haloacid dehalogenase-like hydrolase domain-containing protein Sgpp [Selaginella moellendorffii]|eukprot:XP_002970578.2 haloacid dehalogenase-like hydrolase domain-containing protein Sgpp [Selaginella moellendorffii]